jgi:glucoamylase
VLYDFRQCSLLLAALLERCISELNPCRSILIALNAQFDQLPCCVVLCCSGTTCCLRTCPTHNPGTNAHHYYRHTVCGIFVSQLVGATSLQLTSRQSNDIDNFVLKESPIAFQGILNNIGANGSQVRGASSGIVVASPSTQDPDYFFTWTRDSALTLKFLVDSYIHGNIGLGSLIQEYILAQARLQTVDNLSGTFASGNGLGDPKYYTNETAFLGNWGRPQHDGPALRAIAMIAYSKIIMTASGDNKAIAHDVIWPIVRNDLNYVAQYWNQTGFDLWEEVNGSSFFTTAVQYRALIEGAKFAQSVDETCEGCTSQAPNALCLLQSYWNGTSITSNINLQGDNRRSGLDCNSILTSINMYDPDSGCTDSTFQPCSSRALSNHKAVVDSFRGDLYNVNSNLGPGAAAAVGRYAEDVYYEGNPWYLCTLAAAEQLYSAANQWNATGSIVVDNLNADFFGDLGSNVANGNYTAGSPEFTSLITAVRGYADGFVGVIQKYAPENGALAEQFSRRNGTAVSARDLTWSYASFLTMEFARNGTLPQTWGEGEANNVPITCQASSANGSYTKPTATSFPTLAGAVGGNGSVTGSSTAGAISSAAASKVRPFLRW